MPPELAEVRQWPRKAQDDRRMAEAGLAQTPPITDGAAFHCQQAVEKCLKAYLVHRREPFQRIHDLEALIDQSAALEADWEQFRDAVESLSPYAVRFRYPGPNDPSIEDVEQALRVVQKVWEFVLSRLPDEVRP